MSAGIFVGSLRDAIARTLEVGFVGMGCGLGIGGWCSLGDRCVVFVRASVVQVVAFVVRFTSFVTWFDGVVVGSRERSVESRGFVAPVDRFRSEVAERRPRLRERLPSSGERPRLLDRRRPKIAERGCETREPGAVVSP
jgi:hypothetical protein